MYKGIFNIGQVSEKYNKIMFWNKRKQMNLKSEPHGSLEKLLLLFYPTKLLNL